MADPRGFLKNGREVASRRPVDERVHDWNEVYPDGAGRALLPIISAQAGRCMDCGIPFCHQGCPLGNLIPEWNDLVWRDDWEEAVERLHATNNFPEFTGRLCPAPCETSCVLGINQDPVTIKNVEVAIADKGWDAGLVRPQAPSGSRAGRSPWSARVRQDWPPRSSSPARGTRSRSTSAPTSPAACCGTASPSSRWRSGSSTAGSSRCSARAPSSARASRSVARLTGPQLAERFDAVVLAVGSTIARDLDVPGRDLAASTRPWSTCPRRTASPSARRSRTRSWPPASTSSIIGGGDTGADCLGTARQQAAASPSWRSWPNRAGNAPPASPGRRTR